MVWYWVAVGGVKGGREINGRFLVKSGITIKTSRLLLFCCKKVIFEL